MKRIILYIMCVIMCLSLCACSSGLGITSNTWKKSFYLDIFNQPTDEYYIGTSNHISGIYNTSSVTDGILEAEVRVTADYVTIELYENGSEKVKNGEYYDIEFPITVKKPDGSTFCIIGTLYSGSDWVIISEVQAQCILLDANTEQARNSSIANALCSEAGEISFYIQREDQLATSYLFSVKCGNFATLYTDEIARPIQEAVYANAERLFEEKAFDAAIEQFMTLGDYSNSANRVNEVVEAKNADAYAKAEALLKTNDFDGAIAAFRALGDYQDSQARIDDVVEAKNADAYEKAEKMLATKNYAGAIGAFTDLKDYRDSSERVQTIVDAVFDLAINSIQDGKLSATLQYLTIVRDYRDVESMINHCADELLSSTELKYTEDIDTHSDYTSQDFNTLLFDNNAQYSAKQLTQFRHKDKRRDFDYLTTWSGPYTITDVYGNTVYLSFQIEKTEGLFDPGTAKQRSDSVGYLYYGACVFLNQNGEPYAFEFLDFGSYPKK